MEEEQAEREERAAPANARYPLAFDAIGNPIEVPAQAIAWRVRRGGGRRGRPRHVFDSETGRQLEVPLGAALEDLMDAGCTPDRYLLYPVDGSGNVIPAIIAVTEVPEGVDADEGVGPQQVVASMEQSILLATIREQNMTIRHQSDCLARSLEATTSGYGRVRPIEAPTPIVVEQPPPPSGLSAIKPEQIADLLKLLYTGLEMLKGMASGGGAMPPMGGVP